MKINRTGYAQFVKNLEKSRKAPQTEKTPEGKDTIQLSEASQKIKTYAEALRTMETGKADKLEAIRAKLDAGTYRISSKELAEKILAELKSQAGREE